MPVQRLQQGLANQTTFVAYKSLLVIIEYVISSPPAALLLNQSQRGHPVKDKRRRTQDGGAGKKAACAWRQKASKYISAKLPGLRLRSGRITYIECLEMQGVQGVPKSARERNLLNLMSCLPEPQPQTLNFNFNAISMSILNLSCALRIHRIPYRRP